MNKNTEKIQKDFFDNYAKSGAWKNIDFKNLYTKLSHNEQLEGLRWISNSKIILDYGCGVGANINSLSMMTELDKHQIYGVDISPESIEVCRNRFNGKFQLIIDNKIDMQESFVDAVYLSMVLHHSEDHYNIIKEISRILKPGGKLFIIDLTSDNIFINIGRFVFPLLPSFIKNKFNDDLQINGEIPEKLPVKIKFIKKTLIDLNFTISKVEKSQLFIFILDWIERILRIPISKNFPNFIRWLYKVDKNLSNHMLISNAAHTFSIYAIKNK